MSDILSQEEVDSLLSGLSTGKIESENEAGQTDPDGVSSYDFTSQDQVIRGRMPTFEVLNDRFAREIRTSLSALLHTNVDIAAESHDILKFSEFGRSLPVPTSLHVFRLEPLRGHALFVMESQLVFNLIDQFFGGKGNSTARIEGREFTSIEQAMIYKVVRACLKDLETAWMPVEQVHPSMVRSEVNPQFAAIVMPTDLVIVSRFEVELEQSAGTLIVCIPYAMIEPIRGKLSAGFQAETEDVDYTWQKRLKEIIFDSRVEMQVCLGKTEITGERLIGLKEGDVIELDQDASDTLLAMVGGVKKLKGYAGTQRGFQAFSIEEKLYTR